MPASLVTENLGFNNKIEEADGLSVVLVTGTLTLYSHKLSFDSIRQWLIHKGSVKSQLITVPILQR